MKLIIFVSMIKIRFIYFLILSLLPSYIYAQKSDTGPSYRAEIAILILLIIVLYIFYLIRQEKKEAQKKKEAEEYDLELEKALEGLNSEVINSASSWDERKRIFKIRSYDIGYYEPRQLNSYSDKVKTKIDKIQEFRWVDSNGNLLKDSVFVLHLLAKKIYKELFFEGLNNKRPYSRKTNISLSITDIIRDSKIITDPPSGSKKKSLYIINGIYFSVADSSWYKRSDGIGFAKKPFADPELFNGKINGIEYVDGYPEKRNHTNSIKG